MLARGRYGLAILTLLCMQAPGFAQQGFWQNDVEAAKRLAAQTNRLVLIHFSAPWCMPCARLEENVFGKPGFSSALEPNYVGVKINLDDHKKLASLYDVRQIPTDVIITPQGQVVQKLQSPPTIENYLGAMQQVAVRARSAAAIAANRPPPGSGALPVAPPIMPPNSPPPGNSPGAQQTAANAAGQKAKLSDDRYADYFSGVRNTQSPDASSQMAAASMQAAPMQNAVQSPAGNSIATADPASRGAYGGSTAAIPAVSTAVGGATDRSTMTPVAATPNAPVASNPIMSNAVYSQPGRQQPAANPPATAAAPPGGARTKQLPPGSPPLGLDGYCPVTLVEKQSWKDGDVRFGAIHHGRTYLFAGQAEQQRFLANPEAFSPVMSGDDPVLALDENKSVPGYRKHGVFFSNRIYLFSSEATQSTFSKNPGRYAPEITQARR